ncbi:MAG: GNAT family N-acetyltransferase [Fibrobacteres bacterium]|jgi:hypothetical protein|nr:GNAT family N-acetyltransferase [Fibrobacterota bacterium]
MGWSVREDWDPQGAPDIYFTRAYADLYRTSHSLPLLFEYGEGGKIFRLPYLESSVRAYLPDADPTWKDMETPYGYGGWWSTSADSAFLASAGRALESACRERGIIAAFIRFHPLLGNHEPGIGFRVIADRETVCMDLQDTDPWRNQVSQKNRNMIRKAEKAGVAFEVDEGFGELEAFAGLYAATMERLEATASYRFDAGYFTGMAKALRGHGFLAHCRHQGAIVASAAIMHWGPYGHYHLSGSLREAQSLAPNNLLLYRCALELQARGCRVFHLGGGTTTDPGDPLLKFKQAFSPGTRRFHFGMRVFDESAYARVRELWALTHDGNAGGARVLFYKE